MKNLLDLRLFPKTKPDRTNILNKEGFHPAHYSSAITEILCVMNSTEITLDHDLILDENFECLTQEAYNYLLPRIINAYLNEQLNFSGNFATQFIDSLIDDEVDWFDGKYGRKKIRDRHNKFLNNLDLEQKVAISSAINELLNE